MRGESGRIEYARAGERAGERCVGCGAVERETSNPEIYDRYSKCTRNAEHFNERENYTANEGEGEQEHGRHAEHATAGAESELASTEADGQPPPGLYRTLASRICRVWKPDTHIRIAWGMDVAQARD